MSCNVGSRSGIIFCFVMSILAVACGGPATPRGPNEVLTAYSNALLRGDTQAAYALLSDDVKRSTSYEAFAQMVRENEAEVRELAKGLAGPAYPPYVTATVTAPGGETLELVLEDGAWRVEGAAIDLYSQQTPRGAVLSFVRAYENNRYDLLMRFVPDSKKEGLTPKMIQASFEGKQREALDRLSQALKREAPRAEVEILGDRATLRYGGAGTVELIEEAGVWKIEEFYP